MSQLFISRAGLATLVVIATCLVGAPGAWAANLVVTEAGDPPVGTCSPGPCSLRDAVEAADANSESDVITFAIETPASIRLAGTSIDVDSNEGIAITGPGSGELTITGDSNDDGPDAADSRIFTVGPGAVLSMSGVALTEGQAADGGAVLSAPGSNLMISQSLLFGNRSLTDGGAVSTAGAFVLVDSTVSANSADRGGGLSISGGPAVIARSTVYFNSAAARGGGIAVSGVAGGGSVTVLATTIAQNSGSPLTWGGGIYIGGPLDGRFAVETSTISGNAAGGGGGVAFGDFNPDSLVVTAGGSLAVENSTVASNSATVGGGGLYFSGYSGGDGPQVRLFSSIVGDNLTAGSPEDLDSAGVGSGGLVKASLSLVEAPGDAPISIEPEGENIFNVDPALNPLTTNGGPTLTHLPDEDSPVIDRGGRRFAVTSDQRGRPRPIDNAGIANAPVWDGTDIGAVEISLLPPSLGRCRGVEVTILATADEARTVGTSGRDVILGTSDRDGIRGFGGRDLICAGGGRDIVQAGGGDDTVLGSGGADRLFGQTGSDVVIGGDGNDRIAGSGGADRLFGLAGDDHLAGGSGPDGLYGHAGADELFGGKSADDLFGGPGRDRLAGGPQRDYLRGGPGRDAELQ